MTAMMVEDGKCVAAAGARVEGHAIQIAESPLIARDILNRDLATQTGARLNREVKSAKLPGSHAPLRS